MEALFLPCMGLAHWPIRLEIDLQSRPKNRAFQFEAFRLRDLDLLKQIEESWTNSEEKGRNCMHTFQLNNKELKK